MRFGEAQKLRGLELSAAVSILGGVCGYEGQRVKLQKVCHVACQEWNHVSHEEGRVA